VQIEPVEPDAQIPVELDGETPGYLPATFEILPQALRIRL
jgi:diacylglycerol kinase family enzyme